MTRFGRAFLGATFGAALTLLLHPASRPYLLSVFIAPSQKSVQIPEGVPNDLVQLSDWMSAIGDQFVEHRRVTSVEAENAVAVANQGVKLDPRNAFWHQMLAYLYHFLGRDPMARSEWEAASHCDTWNDYQSVELLRDRSRLAREFGADQSWQLGYLYYQRTKSAVLLITSYSHFVLANAPITTNDGLLLRTANVINGDLLRQGSRSIAIGDFGAAMSEDASHPPNVSRATGNHKLYLARVQMQTTLRDLGKPILADRIHKIYNEVDGWDAIENNEDAAENAKELSYLSLLYVGLPSMLIVVGVVGVLLWLLGHALRRLERIDLPPAIIAGIVFGVSVYSITFLPLASIATFLCCLFLTLGPKRERRVKIDDLGPMFGFTAGTLGLVFMFLLGAFVVGFSAPAASLLPDLEVPREYFGGSGVLLGLAIIVLAVLLLLAPLFAMALRVGTTFVLSKALKRFGSFLAYTSLLAIVIGTPICIYFDREASKTLEQLVLNEPVHYYLNLHR